MSTATAGVNFVMHASGQQIDQEINAQLAKMRTAVAAASKIQAQIPVSLGLSPGEQAKLTTAVTSSFEKASSKGAVSFLDKIGTTASPDRIAEGLRRFAPNIGLAIGAMRVAQAGVQAFEAYGTLSRARGRGDLEGEIAAQEGVRRVLTDIPIAGPLGEAIANVTKNRADKAAIEDLEFQRRIDEQKIGNVERRVQRRKDFVERARAAVRTGQRVGMSPLAAAEFDVQSQEADFDRMMNDPADRQLAETSGMARAMRESFRRQRMEVAYQQGEINQGQTARGNVLGYQNRGDMAASRREAFEESLRVSREEARRSGSSTQVGRNAEFEQQRREKFNQDEARDREAAERETAERITAARVAAEEMALRDVGKLREADQRAFEAQWDARIRKIEDAYLSETDNEEKVRLLRQRDAALQLRAVDTWRRAREEQRREERAEAGTQGVEQVNALRGAGRYAEADDAAFEAAAAARLSDPNLDAGDRARAQREIDSERAARTAERARGVDDRIAGARENQLRAGRRNRLADYLELRRSIQRNIEAAGDDPGLRAAAEAEGKASLALFRRDMQGERSVSTTDMRSFYGGLLESAVLGGTDEGRMKGKDREDILRDIGKDLDGAAEKLDKAADKIIGAEHFAIVGV